MRSELVAKNRAEARDRQAPMMRTHDVCSSSSANLPSKCRRGKSVLEDEVDLRSAAKTNSPVPPRKSGGPGGAGHGLR